MKRLSVVLIIAFIVYLFFFSKIPGAGVGFNFGVERFELYASTNIVMMLIALLLFFFIITYKQYNYNEEESKVNILVRLISFMIDAITITIMVTPFFGAIIIVIEYISTSEFAWEISRSQYREGDNIVFLLILMLYISAFLYYFTKHLKLSRPTIGQYIMGYKVSLCHVSKITFTMLIKNILIYVFVLLIWPIILIYDNLNKTSFIQRHTDILTKKLKKN